MKLQLLIIFVLLTFNLVIKAERAYTDEEKEAFLNLWNTGKSIALIGVDDILSEEVEKILSFKTVDEIEDNAYIYLMGLAENSENPYQTGLVTYQKMLEYSKSDSLYAASEPRPKELHIPEIEMLCEGEYELCYKNIAAEFIQETQNINHQYVDTYLKILKHKHYQQVPQLSWDNTSMQLRYIIFLQQYFHQQIITQNNTQNNTHLVESIFHEHRTLKHWLISTDKPISKLLLISLINRNLDLMVFLLQKNLLDAKTIQKEVAMFTTNEMSYTSSLLSEKSRSYRKMISYNDSLYKAVDNDPAVKIAQLFILGTFSKPNLSLNNDHNFIVKPLITLDVQSADAFKNNIKQTEFTVPDDKIRNTASALHQLFIDSSPNSYIKLKSNFFELNMKIQLLHAFIEQGSAEKVIAKANHGHVEYLSHTDQTVPFINNKKLCHSGFTEHKNKISCLYLIDK